MYLNWQVVQVAPFLQVLCSTKCSFFTAPRCISVPDRTRWYTTFWQNVILSPLILHSILAAGIMFLHSITLSIHFHRKPSYSLVSNVGGSIYFGILRMSRHFQCLHDVSCLSNYPSLCFFEPCALLRAPVFPAFFVACLFGLGAQTILVYLRRTASFTWKYLRE